MNPIGWFAWFHGKFFAKYPLLGYLVAFCVGGLIILSFWSMRVDKYNKEHQATTSRITNLSANQSETSGVLTPDIKALTPSSPDKQIVRFEFKDQAPFLDRSPVRIDEGARRWDSYFYRVRLVNTSHERAVKVLYLKLTELEQFDGNEFKPWPNTEDLLLDWDAEKPKEIPPGGNVLAWFARVFPPDLQRIVDKLLTGPNDIPQLVFTVLPGGWPMKMISKVPPGTHRFKLTAYFENAPPAAARIEMTCPPEQGRDSIEVTVKKIRMRLL